MCGRMQRAYVVKVEYPSLGSGAPTIETVYVLADHQDDAARLVRIGLRLSDDQVLSVVRMLSEQETKALSIKPFQVKHA